VSRQSERVVGDAQRTIRSVVTDAERERIEEGCVKLLKVNRPWNQGSESNGKSAGPPDSPPAGCTYVAGTHPRCDINRGWVGDQVSMAFFPLLAACNGIDAARE
jgi:hypothetical protein